MQLVELQRSVQAMQADEVALFAISYDPVETLAGFAREHGVTYPLLSDVGSVKITELGMLNTQIESEVGYWNRSYQPKHVGLPYPGTFVLDESGVVADKTFERSHRLRPGGGVLLERLGVEGVAPADVTMADGPGLSVAAWVDEREYFPNQINRLTLRFALEDEFHLYLPPNPNGFTNLAISVEESEGLFVDDYELPVGHPFSVQGLSEEFNVSDGEFDVLIPFYILEDKSPVTLQVGVEYQACNDEICLVPSRLQFAIDLLEIRA